VKKTKFSMGKRILVIGILLLAEVSLGYYSLFINGSLFSKFLFFLLSAAIVSFAIITGIQYILPSEDDFHHLNKDQQP